MSADGAVRPYIRVSRRAKAKPISIGISWGEYWTFLRARYEGNRHMRKVYAERARQREESEKAGRGGPDQPGRHA